MLCNFVFENNTFMRFCHALDSYSPAFWESINIVIKHFSYGSAGQ